MTDRTKNSPEHVGAYNLGARARLNNETLNSNPHHFFGSDLYDAWRDGWLDEDSNFTPTEVESRTAAGSLD